MKQVIVVSDDHNHSDKLNKIHQMYPNAALYLHAGDSCNLQSTILPFLTVKGNNDYYISNTFRVESVDDVRIYLTHGHLINLQLDNIVEIAKAHNCSVFIHGHIHYPYYVYHQGVHILCPGALSYPRRGSRPSYMILEINGKDIKVKTKTF